MSLILDALRKSEAERRRGQAPDLHAELPPLIVRTTAPRRSWPWWLAGALAVAATLWLLRSGAPATPAAADSVEPAPAATHADADTSMPAAGTVVDYQADAGPAVAAPVVTQPVSAPPAARPAPTVTPPQPQAAAVAPAPVAAPPIESPQPQPVAAVPAPTVAASAPSPATTAVALPDPPTPPPATSQTSLMRLADLSAGEREQLPALKISMHMWGPTPDERFAIIDGSRVSQGDRVGDAVVEEITVDSVVLDWQGRRLALPIR